MLLATSLPTIQQALGIAPDQTSWVQTAYLIAEVVAIPLTGSLTRLLGMRRLFGAAVFVFSVASLGCAASTGFAQLIAWRVLQGFCGGTLIPIVFASDVLAHLLRLRRTGGGVWRSAFGELHPRRSKAAHNGGQDQGSRARRHRRVTNSHRRPGEALPHGR